jgi:2-polyprenyl-3-methyl-5-hydroxy-6-metoxy-1,4-benzoquinol methylase
MSIDSGVYNKNTKLYHKLISDVYNNFPEGINLTAEYAQFIQEDLLRFLIRLARYKFVARQLKKTDHVLEVGSGSGLGSIFMAQHCAKVTGLDVKITEVEEAKSINQRENVEFIVGDLFDMKLSQYYDVVVNLDIIEHMPIEQGRKLVKAMAKHLKPTGMLALGTPSIYSYEYQSPLSQASHVHCYDLPELVDLIESYFERTLSFSMNDELIHTGHYKMAWYYFVMAFMQKP